MAATSATDYFSGLRDSLTSLAIDYGRARLVDVETREDDRNVPDQADVRARVAPAAAADSVGGSLGVAPAGVPIALWGVGGVAVLGLLMVLMRGRK